MPQFDSKSPASRFDYKIARLLNYKMHPWLRRSDSCSRNQRGYILLTLMLFVAVLAIGAMAWIEKVDFQIKRDREQELIHRGVQYSRAVRRYFKKFGRYPTRIEELENTNNIRFLRQRYKDPITGKDFKLLHMNDVRMSFNPGAASGLPPGAGAGIVASQPGAPGALNATAAAPGGFGPSAIPAGQQSPQPGDQAGAGQDANATQNTNAAQNDQAAPGGTVVQASPQQQPVTQADPAGQRVFGGLGIVGVVSTSKLKTIREFNKKDHYNQWQFIYDPSTDRGGLLMTPNQPPLQGALQNNQQQNGAPGAPGQNPDFGNSGFGNQGFGNQGPGPTQGGTNTSPQQLQPTLPPDQQQQ
jgi:hypothetical protein